VRRAEAAAGELQGALNSQVVIEQAKGMLAERVDVDMDEAFQLLRRLARDNNQQLTDVARHLINTPIAYPPQP
jgi:AmiR/NasT family two-component response regulator